MKNVLISIRPKYVELIVSGEKTVEVRRTRPKCEVPFKCYIYETQGRTETPWVDEEGHRIFKGRGMVIGEFACDKIYDITPHFDTPTFPNQYICGWDYGKEFDCLSFEELTSYLNGKKGYAWHITDLVVYDEPRELSEFEIVGCQGCRDKDTYHCKFHCFRRRRLKRPPQSWCYIEPRQTAD
jgi:predicted transcriptional regulator